MQALPNTPTPTPTSATMTNTPMSTPTFTPTASQVASATPIFTPTDTPIATNTPTPLLTTTQVASDTPTSISTSTSIATNIPTLTPTPTATTSVNSLTLNPVVDTYVNSASPSTNYGSATTMRLDGSPDVHAYLGFTVAGLSGTIMQVRLLLHSNNSDSKGIAAWAVADNSWGELTTNYTNAPALGSQLATSGSFASGVWVSLDVTSYVTGNGTYSFGVTNPSSTAISVASREAGANAPQLVITYH